MAAPSENLQISGLPMGVDEAAVKGIFEAYGDITSVKVNGQSAFIKFATADEAKWIQENLNGNMPEGLTEPIEVKFAAADAGKGKGKDNGKAAKGEWSKGWDNSGKGDWYGKGGKGEKADSWGPYASGGKDFGGKDGFKGKDGKDGKGKGKGKPSVRTLFAGLCDAGALPGGSKYENDENTIFVGGLPEDTENVDLYKMFSPFGAIAPKGVLAINSRETRLCKGYGFVNYMDNTAAEAAIAALNGYKPEFGKEIFVCQKRLEDGKSDSKGDGKGDGKGKGKWKTW